MINVIGLCGYATAGKDEAARGLEPFGFQRVSFADPVRAAALAIDPIVAYNVDHIPVSPVRLSDLVLAYGWEAKRNPEARSTKAVQRRCGYTDLIAGLASEGRPRGRYWQPEIELLSRTAGSRTRST